MSTIEDEMREMVRAQTAVGGEAAGALEEAQTAIIQLFRWVSPCLCFWLNIHVSPLQPDS